MTADDTYMLELITAKGLVSRPVKKSPPRDCRPSEVPTIDVSAALDGTAADRRALAQKVRDAAENTGFFYIQGHGIADAVMETALAQSKRFFAQSTEAKERVSRSKSKFFNGWNSAYSGLVSPSEGKDNREGFSFRYHPRYDPEPKDLDAIPPAIQPYIRGEEFVWEGTADLPGFKEALLTWWREALRLARQLIRIFALALGLEEDHFDSIVTYPGSDGVVNYYPKNTHGPGEHVDVGIGAHTDLQCFTLLYQDTVGGLQVLSKAGEWVRVPPVPGTFVVNIGDFLMRLSNDRFTSNIHRVYNRAPVDRYSLPFFFGFNFNETCAVLPTCVDEKHPPKYEPISCGEWCQKRFEITYGERKITG